MDFEQEIGHLRDQIRSLGGFSHSDIDHIASIDEDTLLDLLKKDPENRILNIARKIQLLRQVEEELKR